MSEAIEWAAENASNANVRSLLLSVSRSCDKFEAENAKLKREIIDYRDTCKAAETVSAQFAADAVALRKELDEINQRDPWWCDCEFDGVDERDIGKTCEAHDAIGAATDEAEFEKKRADAHELQEVAYLDTIHRLEERLAALEVGAGDGFDRRVNEALNWSDQGHNPNYRIDTCDRTVTLARAYRAAQARIAELEAQIRDHLDDCKIVEDSVNEGPNP